MFRVRVSQILRFSRYLLPYWDKELALIAGRFFAALLGLATPFLARLTVDYAYNARDLHVYNALVIAGGLIWLLTGLLGVIRQYLEAYVQQMVDLDMQRDYYKHLQRLSLRFFQTRSTGEQMYRSDADIQGVSGLVISTIPSVLITAVQLVGLLAISLWLHWRLTLIILAVAPLFYVHAHYFGNKQRAIYKRVVEKSQQISAQLQEAISHTRLIKAFGREQAEVRRYVRRWVEKIRLTLERTRMTIYSTIAGSLLNTVVVTGLSYYLGYQLIRGYLSLGTLVALSLYLLQLLNILRSLGNIYSGLVVRFVSIDRLLETLDAPIEISDAPDAVVLDGLRGEIGYQDVTFGYDAGKPVLREVDFVARPGETVALVGPSGAGKTSIINLLLRFYDPWAGQVRVDGHDLRKVTQRSLRGHIGVALQDPMLLNDSIRANILFGCPSATAEEAEEAARLADAHEFILELPRGYDTAIGEEGCNLSAGQKQRIAIARALVKRPRILILDEAMSSISSASEQRILEALAAWKDACTMLIASHRLSTIRHADRILVLDQGRIVESGAHEALLAARGAYYALFVDQLERPSEAAADVSGKDRHGANDAGA